MVMEKKQRNSKEGPEENKAAGPQEQSGGEQASTTPEHKEYKPKGQRKQFSPRRDIVPSEFVEKVVAINRVTKVTKGGKRLAFSALVVVGDGKGKVGYSLQKASEVATAIKKSLAAAKRSMIRVHLYESTITHQINGVCGGAVVMLKPASEGTGVIAAGPVRAVCDSAGIRNILTKCQKSNNPINVVKATMDGLSRLKARKVQIIANTNITTGAVPNASA